MCLSTCLSVGLSVCLCACPSVFLPACLSVCLPFCLSICLSVLLSICLSVHLSVCLQVYTQVPAYLRQSKDDALTTALWQMRIHQTNSQEHCTNTLHAKSRQHRRHGGDCTSNSKGPLTLQLKRRPCPRELSMLQNMKLTSNCLGHTRMQAWYHLVSVQILCFSLPLIKCFKHETMAVLPDDTPMGCQPKQL